MKIVHDQTVKRRELGHVRELTVCGEKEKGRVWMVLSAFQKVLKSELSKIAGALL